MTELTKQQQYELLNTQVKAAFDALKEAQYVADKYGLTFYFSPAYGMGGTYDGRTPEQIEEEDGYYNSDASDNGWYSSTMSC